MTSRASTSLDAIREESHGAGAVRRTSTAVTEGVGSLVKYEPMCAVPARVLKPAAFHSFFTCYVFSEDGSRLAAGDSEGTVRVWTTTDYDEFGAGELKAGVPVSALTFFDGSNDELVAVDKQGNLRRLTWTLSTIGGHGVEFIPVQDTLTWALESRGSDNSGHDFSMQHQFSSDGLTLAHFFGQEHPTAGNFTATSCYIYHLKDGFDPLSRMHLDFGLSPSELSVPVLSENGESLLISSLHREETERGSGLTTTRVKTPIKMVPLRKLQSGRGRTFVRLQGNRASWGLDGQYLMLWEENQGPPRLSIYQTAELSRRGEAAEPFAQMTLRLGLFSWEAMMLKPQSSDNSDIHVLIYETSERENDLLRRFFIWDAANNAVDNESQMNLSQNKGCDNQLRSSGGCPVECSLPAQSFDTFYYRVIGDCFPSFCTSDDGQWIGAFSWLKRGGGISSMKTGVTAWMFRIPDCRVPNPCRLPTQAVFDRQNRHFVIFSDAGFIAYKPPFLCADAESEFQSHVLLRSSNLARTISVEQAETQQWQALPGAAVAKKWTAMLRNGRQNLWDSARKMTQTVKIADSMPSITHEANESSYHPAVEPIDGSQSADGSLAALILLRHTHQNAHCLYIAKKSSQTSAERVARVKFPGTVQPPFVPSRVFLAVECGRSGNTAVLFSTEQLPVILLYDIESGSMDRVKLKAEKCLDVSFAEDRTQIVILDVHQVHVFSLKTRNIENSVGYKVNFVTLLEKVDASLLWRRETEGDAVRSRTERRLADSGKAVLLAWDLGKNKSILVRPRTKQSECESQITAAREQLSDFCVLSATGTSTSFVHVGRLERERKIALGVYNERVKKVVFRFHVEEQLPSELHTCDLARVLSDVFYGISKDGNQLIALTMGLHRILPETSMIEDEVRVFSIGGAEDTIPTYDQLTLKRFESVKQTFKKMHEDHGVAAFSAPLSDGISIFQKAFVERDRKMVDYIKKLAKKHQCLLALEWQVFSQRQSNNVLEEALATQTVDFIEDALRLVCSKVAPFRSAAAITKQAFNKLAANNLDLLENALKEKLFVTHACDLDVHVKFMREKSRLETAQHIDTSDTFLDWVQTKDAAARDENWRRMNWEAVKKMETGGNKSTTPVSLHFVRIEDAAHPGMEGIIRPLLLRNAPAHFFEYDVVKWVVQFKWAKIWKERFLKDAALYGFFLLLFTVYACLLSTTKWLSRETFTKRLLATIFLAFSAGFGVRMVWNEIRQMRNYEKDRKDHAERHGSKDGKEESWFVVPHWYFFSKWNWLDVVSCCLLLIVIPPLHFSTLFYRQSEEWLSAFVAIECLVAYAKVLYFCQPFRNTGPLVRMIAHIVVDSVAFLILTVFIMLGFGVAMPVLLRASIAGGDGVPHAETPMRELVEDFGQFIRTPDNDKAVRTATDALGKLDVYSDDEETLRAVKEEFGRLDRSILTLFYAMLGNFEREVYQADGNISILVTATFIFYLLAQTILLLNLLISIMADTFDKVKCTEESELLLARARFIDACEAELSPSALDEIRSQTGKYLHALTEESEVFSRQGWTGKLDSIAKTVKRITLEAEKDIEKKVQKMMDAQQKILNDQDAKISGIESQLKTMLAMLEALAKTPRQAEGSQPVTMET